MAPISITICCAGRSRRTVWSAADTPGATGKPGEIVAIPPLFSRTLPDATSPDRITTAPDPRCPLAQLSSIGAVSLAGDPV
jgi:hypothetical protein